MTLRFNMIGAGRLGKNLAYSLTHQGLAELGAVCNLHKTSADQAVKLIGEGIAVSSLAQLPTADLTLITVPDDAIGQIASELAKNDYSANPHYVIHCSGALNSTLLKPVAEKGCKTASFHPLKAFNTSVLDKEVFKKCDCVAEGDLPSLNLLSQLCKQLGANFIQIQTDQKATYHAAAVIASNYLVTLAARSIELLQQIGISTSAAKSMISKLMQSSLNNINQAEDAAKALTGPLVRGDLATIKLHLEAITNPDILALYQTAGMATLPLTNLDEQQQALFQQLFRPQENHSQ